jgi:hypothetical protein
LFNSSSMRFLCVWCVQVRRRAPRFSRGDRSMHSSLVLHLAHPPQRRLAPPTCISHSFPPSSSTDHDIWHVYTHTHTKCTLLLLRAGCPRACPERPAALECKQPAGDGRESAQVAASYPLQQLRLRHSTASRLLSLFHRFMTDSINIRKVYKC